MVPLFNSCNPGTYFPGVKQLQVSVSGRAVIPDITIATGRELHARGRCCHDLYGVVHTGEFLMNMSAEYRAHLWMAIHDRKQIGGVLQPHPVHPWTADRYRRMMQTDQRMFILMFHERLIQKSQFSNTETSGVRPR